MQLFRCSFRIITKVAILAQHAYTHMEYMTHKLNGETERESLSALNDTYILRSNIILNMFSFKTHNRK